jgi:uncharacterized paraquat-inducible protein A
MATKPMDFRPASGLRALLDQLYDIKFSKHTTLVVVLLSMIYTVYRTQHYLSHTFALPGLVAWPTSVFIELLVLAAAAFVFGALRHAYIAELKDVDAVRAKSGIYIGWLSLVGAFLALTFVAWSDAYSLTHEVIATLVMTLSQFTQMLFIVGFITAADLDEREKLRTQIAAYKEEQETERIRKQAEREAEQQRLLEEQARKAASECPHCHKPLAANNRRRHINSCPARPLTA